MIRQLYNIVVCYSKTLYNVNTQYISNCVIKSDVVIIYKGEYNWRPLGTILMSSSLMHIIYHQNHQTKYITSHNY